MEKYLDDVDYIKSEECYEELENFVESRVVPVTNKTKLNMQKFEVKYKDVKTFSLMSFSECQNDFSYFLNEFIISFELLLTKLTELFLKYGNYEFSEEIHFMAKNIKEVIENLNIFTFILKKNLDMELENIMFIYENFKIIFNQMEEEVLTTVN